MDKITHHDTCKFHIFYNISYQQSNCFHTKRYSLREEGEIFVHICILIIRYLAEMMMGQVSGKFKELGIISIILIV
ncbi:MAG: hypothetical protein ACJ72V_19705, partial [Nitrososphaeraceae archaeon]